jgi:hypothetical protein
MGRLDAGKGNYRSDSQGLRVRCAGLGRGGRDRYRRFHRLPLLDLLDLSGDPRPFIRETLARC